MSLPLALAYGTTGTVMGYFIRLKKRQNCYLTLRNTRIFGEFNHYLLSEYRPFQNGYYW